MKLEKIYNGRQGGDRKSDEFQSGQNVHLEDGKTRDLVAGKIQEKKGVKMSGRKYDRLKTIATKAVSEVKDRFNDGEITQKDALALAKVEPDEQNEIIQSGLANITRKVKQVEKNKAKDEIREKGKDLEPIPEVRILAGDIAEIGNEIDDSSVDLILTDPPYPKEQIECWKKLAFFASRVLKPGRFLVTYSSHINLVDVVNILSGELNFYWIASLIHSGTCKYVQARNVKAKWKPILVYQKPSDDDSGIVKISSDKKFVDMVNGSGREKDLHDWQQGLEELYPLIETFSDSGDTVVDPFAGSGTTLIAAYERQRRAIGIEIDEDTVKILKGRIAEMIQNYQ